MKKNHINTLLALALFIAGQLGAQTRVIPAPAQEKPVLLEGATNSYRHRKCN